MMGTDKGYSVYSYVPLSQSSAQRCVSLDRQSPISGATELLSGSVCVRK